MVSFYSKRLEMKVMHRKSPKTTVWWFYCNQLHSPKLNKHDMLFFENSFSWLSEYAQGCDQFWSSSLLLRSNSHFLSLCRKIKSRIEYMDLLNRYNLLKAWACHNVKEWFSRLDIKLLHTYVSKNHFHLLCHNNNLSDFCQSFDTQKCESVKVS